MSADGQRTKWRRKSSENFNRLSRAHERYRQTDYRRQTTDDRQTDGRRHIANMNLSSRSLKRCIMRSVILLLLLFKCESTSYFFKLIVFYVSVYCMFTAFVANKYTNNNTQTHCVFSFSRSEVECAKLPTRSTN